MARSPRTLALVCLLWALIPPTAAEAQGSDISLDRFEQDIVVRSDGSIQVQERLTIRFEGSWNGIERDLMDAHETAEGRSARLRYRIEEITDAQGRELEVERSRISGGLRLRIWVPGAQDAVRQVLLRYEVEGALRFWTEELIDEGRAGPDAPSRPFDELYWNATGHGWEMSIREAVIRVRLPEGATGVGAWGYTGSPGSTEQAVATDISPPDAGIRTTRQLREREGLTVSVIWDAGLVDRPTVLDQAVSRVRAMWPVGLPVVALFGMFLTWRAHGRDPDRRHIMVQYHPPEGLSPAEVGTLVDHRAELHDVTATLVDLAVRGYLTIEEEEASKGILSRLSRKNRYTFHQARPRSDWSELRPHERQYLKGLFPPKSTSAGLVLEDLGQAVTMMGAAFGAWREARRAGDPFEFQEFTEAWAKERDLGSKEQDEREEAEPLASTKLSDLENRFYTQIPTIIGKIYDRLKSQGLYDGRPDRVAQRWAAAGVATLVFGGIAGIMVAAVDMPWMLPHPFALGFGICLGGAIVLGFSPFMGVRTEKGVRVLEHILGFREFLKRVEAPEYARMITSPELFEEYLPFAMALQVEDRWAEAFEDMYRTPPDWYHGTGTATTFRATDFSKQMRTLSTDASRTMASSPSSSSSGSGGGGGGSSGGGSGGGGGRGF